MKIALFLFFINIPILIAGTGSGIAAVPVIYYSKETSLALGGMFTYYNHDNGYKNPDTVQPLFFGTLNKQFVANLDGKYYVNDGFLKISFLLKGKKYPGKFFGVGPNVSDNNVENYTTNEFSTQNSIQLRILDNFFIGLTHKISKVTITDILKGGLLDSSIYTGSTGDFVSGIGFLATYDTRDNVFYPTQGMLTDMEYMNYNKSIGSNYRYDYYKLDAKIYYQLMKNHIIAFEALTNYGQGNVPVNELVSIGGDQNLRGFFKGKYRDKNLYILQADYRYRFHKFWALTVFTGIGNVADYYNKLFSSAQKFSFGGGIRFFVDSKEGIAIRLDYGIRDFSEFDRGVYFSIMEAF